jgi:NADPH-dependent glutamate synthase beta subunit-like oxidoreductase/NAD(P)H-flavin reductase
MDTAARHMELKLPHGLAYADLYERPGLERIDALFLDHLRACDAALADRLVAARRAGGFDDKLAESDLLLALAPHLEDFIAALFAIGPELRRLSEAQNRQAAVFACKRLFVQRQAVKAYGAPQADGFDGDALRADLEKRFGAKFDEGAFSKHVMEWREDEAANADALSVAGKYAAWAVHSSQGRARHKHGVLFKVPHKLDPMALIPLEQAVVDGVAVLRLGEEKLRRREGFKLTDAGTDLTGALDNAHYCIYCHHQGKDSCSTGLREKSGGFKKSAFGLTLAGCPLEEKISEMNELEAAGHTLGALAAVIVDNPMLAGTGHRICNDCMKSCIYQKQEPVDIPQIETRVLRDSLALPWGFEIYGLLTRWNPLNLRRPLPIAPTGYKVLVVGLGPAGYTLAHHLMNDGHAVVAVDGLKIEPLPPGLSGVTETGARVPFRPIRDLSDLSENLDDRVMAGFGGVAEYGITVRWDKNFLKVIRLLLERRREFSMFGGVRFGGTVTVESAFRMGFDHIALCAGAGRPTFVAMPNAMARGVRQASDFLMALQLTGAAKVESVANLQLRLPVVVIGGGLTAIDTGTEALAYYPLQVEKFLSRYETLAAERGEAAVRAGFTPEDAGIAGEFIAHAKAIRAERALAERDNREPNIRELLNEWGGSTIVYRRRLIDAPSYTLNHEEVGKALEEGVRFAEKLSPVAVEVDEFGHAARLKLARKDVNEEGHLIDTGDTVTLPARSILIAAGTQPNTVLGREDPAHVAMDGKYFRAVDEAGKAVKPARIAKPEIPQVLMEIEADGRAVSFFGDLHPSYAGNVVKAMASAKQGYPVVSRTLAKTKPGAVAAATLVAALNEQLRATVHEVVRLTPTIVEVVVKAPLASRTFRPGQFFRLQNFEVFAPKVDGSRLAMEGLAMTGAWVDRTRGLVSTIVLEMGGSSDLCALLKPGDSVVLMGPTGAPTEIPGNETVLLAGGGLGNAVLFSIGQALRNAGSRVVYFAGYKKMIDRYKTDQIERAADQVIWCCDEGPGFEATRPQDKTFVGNIVAAMTAYAEGKLGAPEFPLSEVDRIVAIGSDAMMAAVAKARHAVLAPYLTPNHKAIGSINSPMQCMMKEICAQCLQPHRNPVTGEETVVFSCFNQDQPLDFVDFRALHERLGQNAVQEKLTKLWIDRCLTHLNVRAMAG